MRLEIQPELFVSHDDDFNWRCTDIYVHKPEGRLGRFAIEKLRGSEKAWAPHFTLYGNHRQGIGTHVLDYMRSLDMGRMIWSGEQEYYELGGIGWITHSGWMFANRYVEKRGLPAPVWHERCNYA